MVTWPWMSETITCVRSSGEVHGSPSPTGFPKPPQVVDVARGVVRGVCGLGEGKVSTATRIVVAGIAGASRAGLREDRLTSTRGGGRESLAPLEGESNSTLGRPRRSLAGLLGGAKGGAARPPASISESLGREPAADPACQRWMGSGTRSGGALPPARTEAELELGRGRHLPFSRFPEDLVGGMAIWP